ERLVSRPLGLFRISQQQQRICPSGSCYPFRTQRAEAVLSRKERSHFQRAPCVLESFGRPSCGIKVQSGERRGRQEHFWIVGSFSELEGQLAFFNRGLVICAGQENVCHSDQYRESLGVGPDSFA